jgi:hypothetical protein
MSRKTLFGILSFLPITLFIGYFVSFIFIFLSAFNPMELKNSDTPPAGFLGGFAVAFAIMMLLMLVVFTNLILFIIHAVNNKALPDNERLVWIIVFIFAGLVGFPIYWYMRIYKTGNNAVDL